MPGPSIPWKTLETEAWRTQIDSVPPARYKLASPRTITGSPSFAMGSADQHCVVRVYIGAGEAPDLSLTVSGTTLVPMTNAVGGNLTAQELADLRIEVGNLGFGSVLLATDEPNGSPSAPFTSTAERDAIMPAGVPRRECYMLNEFAPLAPGVPGLVKWIDTGAAWILAPGQVLANYANADGSPILDTTASALGLTPGTFAEIWTSPVLPLWLLDGGYRSFFVEVNRANLGGNTSQTTITASIRGASATSSVYDNMLTYQQANSSAWRGPSVLGTQFRKVGGNLVGVEGPNQLTQREGNKWVGTYVENNTRIRIGYNAGASSDLILIHSAIIKNGVC